MNILTSLLSYPSITVQQPRLPRDSVLQAMSAADSLSLRDAAENLRTASLTDRQKTPGTPHHSHGCRATLTWRDQRNR